MSGEAQEPSGGRRLLVIHNPVAGRRRRKRFWNALELLERDGNELSLHLTEAPGHATDFAGQIRPGEVDLVIAAGGDGTINEVVNGLVAGGAEMEPRPAPVPLALLPLGTSNVLAAEIGLGKSPEAVARAIRDNATIRLCLGRIADAERPEGRFFVLMAGAGIDAHAVAGVDPVLKRRFAQGAYAWSGLQQVRRSRHRRYHVTVDGVRHRAAWVVVAKAGRYGGPFVLATRARLDEPRFEVCLFARGGVWPLARHGSALLLGRLAATPGFTSVLGETVRIEAADMGGPATLEPVQCDGDDMARLPVEIRVVPDALDLVVPKEGPYGRGRGGG
ncbi:MAG: diacylglycerol kinase family lipid kinase [Kiloniellales bacterium]|nr:diacylglycerol kinase family lipid kinase [Kiloniellales bacterium]